MDAIDRDGQKVIGSGVLTTLDNQIDQTTGTLRLRATMPNKDDALFPNQFVNARMLLQEKKGVTLIPNAAVQRNAQRTFVYVVKNDQSVDASKRQARHRLTTSDRRSSWASSRTRSS